MDSIETAISIREQEEREQQQQQQQLLQQQQGQDTKDLSQSNPSPSVASTEQVSSSNASTAAQPTTDTTPSTTNEASTSSSMEVEPSVPPSSSTIDSTTTNDINDSSTNAQTATTTESTTSAQPQTSPRDTTSASNDSQPAQDQKPSNPEESAPTNPSDQKEAVQAADNSTEKKQGDVVPENNSAVTVTINPNVNPSDMEAYAQFPPMAYANPMMMNEFLQQQMMMSGNQHLLLQQQQQQQRQLKVEDALTYLDKVKNEFGHSSPVYNQFLEIMKNFKSQVLDTPGVIARVSELFRGHNALILGFNTFLPPGYRIEISQLPPDGTTFAGPTTGIPGNMGYGDAAYQDHQNGMQVPQNLSQFMHGAGPQAAAQFGGYYPAQYLGMTQPLQFQAPQRMGVPNSQMMHDPHVQMPQAQMNAAMGANADDMNTDKGQPVEFDHAITYVTKIKRRFADDAETYKRFLDILHTYQQEQKSIKEVLDEVSELFNHHSDLLREFTYFLPDAVREKAKQEISRIQQRQNEKKAKGTRGNITRAAAAAAANQNKAPMATTVTVPTRGGIGSSDQQYQADKNAGPLAGNNVANGNQAQEPVEEGISVNFAANNIRIPLLEKRLFSRIKSALASRELWAEFLKCLDLFALEIISRSDLISLLADILGNHTELLEEFDRLLASRGATDNAVEDAWFSMPLTEIDFSQSRRCTPSYRALPLSYPRPPCSERTPLCRSVLNDTWVSVPTGSEDFSFKNMRKNQYEEALFKCEDDRYEIDLIIDSNFATIKVLETLASEIQLLESTNDPSDQSSTKAPAADTSSSSQGSSNAGSSDQPPPSFHKKIGAPAPLVQFRLDKRTLSVIHLKAIARVYGPHGAEILELLRKNPGGAIPIILARLKQKDEEWRQRRVELNKMWKSMMEKNYQKSLDHRSFYFKQGDRKLLSLKSLVSEIRDIASKDDPTKTRKIADAAIHSYMATYEDSLLAQQSAQSSDQQFRSISKDQTPMSSSHAASLKTDENFVLQFDNLEMHYHAWSIISVVMAKESSKDECDKFSAFWEQIIHPLFCLPSSWLGEYSNGATTTSSADAAMKTSKVSIIQSVRDAILGKSISIPRNAESTSASPLIESLFPLESNVTTPYGIGIVRGYSKLDPSPLKQMIEVELSQQGGAVILVPLSDTRLLPQSQSSTSSQPSKSPISSEAFYGNSHFYSFLRLYHLLCSRLVLAKDLCEAAEAEPQKIVKHVLDRAREEDKLQRSTTPGFDDSSAQDSQGSQQAQKSKFSSLLEYIKNFVDESTDNPRFEDQCRNLLGMGSYFLFTIDRLITAIYKQLMLIIDDNRSAALSTTIDTLKSLPSISPASLADALQTTANAMLTPESACFRLVYQEGVLKKDKIISSGESVVAGKKKTLGKKKSIKNNEDDLNTSVASYSSATSTSSSSSTSTATLVGSTSTPPSIAEGPKSLVASIEAGASINESLWEIPPRVSATYLPAAPIPEQFPKDFKFEESNSNSVEKYGEITLYQPADISLSSPDIQSTSQSSSLTNQQKKKTRGLENPTSTSGSTTPSDQTKHFYVPIFKQIKLPGNKSIFNHISVFQKEAITMLGDSRDKLNRAGENTSGIRIKEWWDAKLRDRVSGKVSPTPEDDEDDGDDGNENDDDENRPSTRTRRGAEVTEGRGGRRQLQNEPKTGRNNANNNRKRPRGGQARLGRRRGTYQTRRAEPGSAMQGNQDDDENYDEEEEDVPEEDNSKDEVGNQEKSRDDGGDVDDEDEIEDDDDGNDGGRQIDNEVERSDIPDNDGSEEDDVDDEGMNDTEDDDNRRMGNDQERDDIVSAEDESDAKKKRRRMQ